MAAVAGAGHDKRSATASASASEYIPTATTQSGITPIAGTPAGQSTNARWVVAAVTLYVLLITLVFHGTALSMVAIWLRSDTYAHSFVIPLLSVYLAWRLRGRFSALTVQPEPRVLLLILGFGSLWLLANMVDVQVVQQFAYVALLVSGIWAIVGTGVARTFAFPLGFLFLAVPMGSGLIPPLMEFTADTTEYLLRASGIPVLREGMFLYLPTGTWSVIEECSGVNYVIASVTLGLCYAHLNYTSLWRQSLFVLAAIIAPVLANSARAYFVVLAGHLSDMRLGTGEDHIVFGWIFFGAVMMLMFWIGSYWQQPEATPPDAESGAPATTLQASTLGGAFVLTLLCAACWPVLAAAMNRSGDPVESIALSMPPGQSPWQAVDLMDTRWRPLQPGADRELDQVYATQSGVDVMTVGLHLRQYLQQEEGTELVDSSINAWRSESDDWEFLSSQSALTDLEAPRQVTEARVTRGSDDLLVWSWYRIDDRHATNQYLIKILEAKQQLLEGHRRGARIFIATQLNGDRGQARQTLQNFIAKHLAAIEYSLDTGIADNPGSADRDFAMEPNAGVGTGE
jgi:exosortase A